MILKEYGDKNNKALVLVHAGGLSDWMFYKHIEMLKQRFFLIVPTIDGHGNDNSDFISISKSADSLHAHLKDNYDNRDFYVYGISLGAQIAMQLIALDSCMFSKAIIESCLLYPQKMLIKMMLPAICLSYPLVSKRWFSKLQAKQLYIPDDLFERYYIDSRNLSKDTLLNITNSNMTFDVCFSKNIKTKVLVTFGSKEVGVIKKSATKIHDHISNSEIYSMDYMHHGQMFFEDANKHIEYILEFLCE